MLRSWFPSECPAGWTAWSDSCYRHINSPHSWAEALALCNSLGEYYAVRCGIFMKLRCWLLYHDKLSSLTYHSYSLTPSCQSGGPGDQLRVRLRVEHGDVCRLDRRSEGGPDWDLALAGRIPLDLDWVDTSAWSGLPGHDER